MILNTIFIFFGVLLFFTVFLLTPDIVFVIRNGSKKYFQILENLYFIHKNLNNNWYKINGRHDTYISKIIFKNEYEYFILTKYSYIKTLFIKHDLMGNIYDDIFMSSNNSLIFLYIKNSIDKKMIDKELNSIPIGLSKYEDILNKEFRKFKRNEKLRILLD
jgi:hypothetical protein